LKKWAKTLYPESKASAEGFFTVVRRDAAKKLMLVPYSQNTKPTLIVPAS